MCNKCDGEMKLIAYKWDNDENLIIYRYRCDKCKEEKTKCGILSDRQLKEKLIDEEAYNKFSL
jgi:hypothetical protein